MTTPSQRGIAAQLEKLAHRVRHAPGLSGNLESWETMDGGLHVACKLTVRRADGAVITADIWPVEGGYMWAVGADGREWSRSQRVVPTLAAARQRAVRRMDWLREADVTPPDQFFQDLATRLLEYLKDGAHVPLDTLASRLNVDEGWVSHALGILQQRGVEVLCSGDGEESGYTVWVQA